MVPLTSCTLQRPDPILARAEKFDLRAEDAAWIFVAEESSTRRMLPGEEPKC